MNKPTLPASTRPKRSRKVKSQTESVANGFRKRNRKSQENSDVLISAVISTYLLNHLHQVLQRAEYGATREGRTIQAANFAQLRKVLCMDARSMQDASAAGLDDGEIEAFNDSRIESKVA